MITRLHIDDIAAYSFCPLLFFARRQRLLNFPSLTQAMRGILLLSGTYAVPDNLVVFWRSFFADRDWIERAIPLLWKQLGPYARGEVRKKDGAVYLDPFAARKIEWAGRAGKELTADGDRALLPLVERSCWAFAQWYWRRGAASYSLRTTCVQVGKCVITGDFLVSEDGYEVFEYTAADIATLLERNPGGYLPVYVLVKGEGEKGKRIRWTNLRTGQAVELSAGRVMPDDISVAAMVRAVQIGIQHRIVVPRSLSQSMDCLECAARWLCTAKWTSLLIGTHLFAPDAGAGAELSPNEFAGP